MPSIESFAHKTAKALVVEWLRGAAAKAGYDSYAEFGDLEWRVNRSGPYWGVWEEYPLISHDDDMVWDERGFETPPSFQQTLKIGPAPMAILDVAVQHKGRICFGIEIVHRNTPSDVKRQFLGRCEFPVYLVKSRWVLSQVRVPKRLRYYDRIDGPEDIPPLRHAAE